MATKKQPKPKVPKVSEHQEQVTLMEWAVMMSRVHPELGLLYAIPNGGWRSKRQAAALIKEGVKAGMPDLCLPVAASGRSALYIEMKAKGGRPTELQVLKLAQLLAGGNAAWLCVGWERAAQVLTDYLQGRLEPAGGW